MKKQLIGTLLGLTVGLGIGAAHTADAADTSTASTTSKPAKWKPTKINCRGNGKGGYRQCAMHTYGKVDKVVFDLWINGEYNAGIIFEPFPEDDVTDAPGEPTVDSGLGRVTRR